MALDRPHRLLLAVSLAALGLVTTACEDEITDPGDNFVEGQLTLDASSNVTYAYASLANGGSIVTPADPLTSTEWHVAFRRFSAKLNGGVAGAGTVAGVNLMNNATADSAEVLAFTQGDADAAWNVVTAADIASAVFEEDGIIEDLSGPWFRFSSTVGNLVANPAAAWKVKESDGGYAVFRVAVLTMAGNNPQSVAIEYRRQSAAGTTLGVMDTINVALTGGAGAVDFGSGTVVTPSACNWDISVTPAFEIDFNAGCDAGSFRLDSSENFTTITSASNAPEYGEFLAVISGAFPTTISDATGIFWYNLAGDNRLFPTYNVFLVRVGTDVFKLQVLSYYSTTGTGANPTIRYLQLQ